MEHPAIHFSTVLMAFFAIMNPLANTPVFLGLTSDLDRTSQLSIATRAVLLAFAIVALFAIFGHSIFTLFGITLPAFRIAGGILVGLVGFHLLQGQNSSVHTPTEADNEQSQDAALGIAITPLAMPILAGPGTLATAMSYAAEATPAGLLRVLVAFGVICTLTWISFVGGESLVRFLGQNAIKVVSRLMGLILAVIGVQMVLLGIDGARALDAAS